MYIGTRFALDHTCMNKSIALKHVYAYRLQSRPASRRLTPSLLLACGLAAGLSVFGSTNAAHVASPVAEVAGSVGTAVSVSAVGLVSDERPHAGMLRFPHVGTDRIVFAYANGLWTVDRSGGIAKPVASPPGAVSFPRFSPDGKQLAFVGNYEGNRDLYVIPLDADGNAAAPAHRVTHHSANELLNGWVGNDKLLFASNGLAGLQRIQELFIVPASGGLPDRVAVPYGAIAAVSPDGQWLAYTTHTREFRTWKRYRGGMATDIWLFNLNTKQSRLMTDWEGTDTFPMWSPDGKTVFYLSDNGPEHRQNIWKYDLASGMRQQVTRFTENDVKFPSMGMGPDGRGEIVFQLGADLKLLNLANGQSRNVEVIIPGERPQVRTRLVDAAEHIQSSRVSATGQRAVIEARGDIWTIPAESGAPRNLTRTSGVAERDPAWSPDGRWIAFISDESGEYNLHVMPSDGRGESRKLTDLAERHLRVRAWSPDSKKIAFDDHAGSMYVVDVESGKVDAFDTDPWATPVVMSWSSDSRWVAYERTDDRSRNSAIWVYDTENNRRHRLTSGMFNDGSPAFCREGKYLYYISARDFTAPIYEDMGSTFAYAGVQRLMMATLRNDIESPFLPKSDEETWEDKKDKDDGKDDGKDGGMVGEDDEKPADDDAGEKKDDGKKDDKPKAVAIDLRGFEGRAMVLPVEKGRFANLSVNDSGHLIYQSTPVTGGPATLHVINATDKKPEAKTVLSGVQRYDLSGDGKKILAVLPGDRMAIIDAKADQKADKASKPALTTRIDPREEWAQIFNDAWRRHRDYFYVENMHGVDWEAVREHYSMMLEFAASREDVSFIIGEMISELNVGHAYYWGGDVEPEPSRSVGLLGADFELGREGGNSAYRFKRIIAGADWDADARGPLSQPGVNVKEGDYLLLVNGMPIDTSKDPWAAFIDLAGKTITLTVSEKPVLDSDARDVVVTTLSSEADLRYRDWVERNRAYVAEASSGRVGYIYVPNTGVQGQNELFRQFYSQAHMDALIIDDRWNGGGQIPTRFIELLNRPRTNYWARRHGNDWPWPYDSHQGPKAMLINGLAGSGGDMFPWLFRYNNLGKLVGTRTWGGLVGITGVPPLVDGGYTAVPTFGFYKTDGTWGVEGHGVDPDIEVIDDPALMVGGADPQIDAAIAELLKELDDSPYRPARRPADPDRSGMGLPVEDR